MAQLFANNAYGVLAGTVNGAATLLVLVSGQGARFPAPTNGDHFLATLVGIDGNGAESVWEIVKCTGRNTDQLTVARAQEGTVATTWNAGTRIDLRWTKAGVDSKEDAGSAAAAVAAHTAAADPHPQYATTAEAAAAAPVQSIAGKTGAVVLVKADVGLGNVDNTSDANKPVSTAQQTALNLKANLASPALTGVPTAPTAAGGTNTTQVATTAFVQGALDAKASFVWGAVKTSAFTADNGGVYACNTSAGAFVASLPASPQPGWVATFLDYAGTFDVSSLTVSRNGSNIGGVADDYLLDQKNIGRNFVYADSTRGWLVK